MHFPRTHLFRVCTTASFVAVSIRSNSVGFYYFECCCSQTLPRANATYSVCIEVPRVQVLIGMMSPPIWLLCCFDCLPSLYLNFTCMRTHTVVSSCHLNAVRSLSADCLSIGCFHSFVCHLTCGRDFSIKSLPGEVDASVSSIRSGTKRWEKSGTRTYIQSDGVKPYIRAVWLH